jgi:hypothetical protein
LFEWNLERAKAWQKELHLDYLADLARYTDDPKRAAIIAELVILAQKSIHDNYKELGPFGSSKPPRGTAFLAPNRVNFAEISSKPSFRRYSGDRVVVPKDIRHAFIHSASGTIASKGGTNWICLSRDQLEESDSLERHLWSHSVVVVCGRGAFVGSYKSLIVCDGDVELTSVGASGSTFADSVIVANGDVSLDSNSLPGVSYFYATGDFVGANHLRELSCAIVTGGKNSAMGRKDSPASKHKGEGVKENPLGIKFVSPSDVGVELVVGVKVVRMGKINESSPLMKAGLESGDRVLKVNGVTVDTAADFRRQLRESLLWGTGLFEIKRGDQTFLRLVKFAEPPKK